MSRFTHRLSVWQGLPKRPLAVLGSAMLSLAMLASFPVSAVETKTGEAKSTGAPAITPATTPATTPASAPASTSTPARDASLPRLPQPQPPTPRLQANRAVGWRVVWVRPADKAFASRLVAENAHPPDINGSLPGGTVLTSDRDDAQVLVEYYGGPLGILVQHMLSGKFSVTLEVSGQITLKDGSAWTRVYRFLAEATGKLFMDYEGTPAGFGSTEVIYDAKRRGLLRRPTLSVVEGVVTLNARTGHRTVRAGQSVSVGGLMVPHGSNREQLSPWLNIGTDVMEASLSSSGTCPAHDPALSDAALVSRVCYPDTQSRNLDFADARKAIANGGSASDWLKMGNALLAAGDYDQAADCYRRSAKVGNDAEAVGAAWREFGNAQWLAGRAEEALNGYHKAVEIDVGQAVAWNNLGVLSWSQGNLADARDALRKAVKLDPTFYHGWRNLGRVLVKDSPQDALLAWQRASQIDPYDRALWSDLAATYGAMGRKEQALQSTERRLKLDLNERPEEPILQESLQNLIQKYEDLARELDAQGKQREALQMMDKAMELRKSLK